MKALLEKMNIKQVTKYLLYIFWVAVAVKSFMVINNRVNLYRGEKKVTICPPLLSIGRSARDTLIVMKAEPLCNIYVLENLK